MKPPSPPVVWEIDIPLATNPRLLKTLALVSGLAALISSLFMSVILGAQSDWDDIAPLLGIFALVGLGMFVSFVLIALTVQTLEHRTMPFTTLSRGALWSLLLMLLTFGAVQADAVTEVERILDDIRQDQPVPRLDYLHPVAPMNPGCALFEGQYGAVTLQVETHPDSPRVASLLLRIPGPDQTRALLPAVSRVLGAPHSQDRYQSSYSWDWPEYRAASLHYVPGGPGAPGQTIVSLFYR